MHLGGSHLGVGVDLWIEADDKFSREVPERGVDIGEKDEIGLILGSVAYNAKLDDSLVAMLGLGGVELDPGVDRLGLE